MWTRANAPMRMRCEYSRNRRLEDRRPSRGHHARCTTPPRDERRTVRVEIETGKIAAKQTRCNALSPCPVGPMGGLAIGRPCEGSRCYVSCAWEDSHLLASFTPEQTRPPFETRCSFREDRVPVTMIVHMTRRKDLLLVMWPHETLQNGGGLKSRAQQSIQQHGERQQQEWEKSKMASEPDRLQSLFVLHRSLQVIAMI